MNLAVNRLGKEFLIVGLGQAVAAVGGIVGVRLMTGVLTPQDYGEVALAITFVTLITQIMIGPLSVTLTRYFNYAQEKGELPLFFGSSAALALRIILATVLIFLAGSVILVVSGRSELLSLAVFTFIFAMISGVNVLMDSIQTAARQRAVVAWHQGLGQWLRYLAAVALVLMLVQAPAVAMAGYAFSALVVIVSQAYFFKRKFAAFITRTFRPDPAWTQRILKYSLPFASWGIFTWLQMTSDRWALQTFASTQDVGFYAVLYQLGYYPVMMLSNVFSQFVQPVLFRQAGDGTEPLRLHRVQRNTRMILFGAFGVTILAVVAAIGLHQFIFQIFAAPAYRSVSSLLPLLVLSSGLFACGQIATMTQLNRGDSRSLLKPKIAMGVLGTLFNLGGAYWMGLNGVVYAGVLFSVLYLAWILLIPIAQSS